MSETVRILVNRGEAMVWPQRCPRCGAKDNLVAVQSTAVRESFSLWLNSLTIGTESLEITSVACQDHAWPNELGINIWKKTGLTFLARMLVYLACALTLLAVFNLLRGVVTWEHDRETGGMFLLGGFALAGALVLWWGRRAAAVLPLRLDQDQDVAVIRFRDKDYAREFRRANARATNPRLVAPPVFFMRPDFWKVVIVIGLVLFLARL